MRHVKSIAVCHLFGIIGASKHVADQTAETKGKFFIPSRKNMDMQYGPLPMLVVQLAEQHTVNAAHDTLRGRPERVICLFF